MNYTFVDHILELEEGQRILAVKNITQTEDYLDEYYPHLGNVPGSLIIESMASTAALLLFASTHFASFALLVMIEKAVFMHPVYPGDRMLMEVELLVLHTDAAQLEAVVRVGTKTAASATLMLGLFEIQRLVDPQMKTLIASLLERTKNWIEWALIQPAPGT